MDTSAGRPAGSETASKARRFTDWVAAYRNERTYNTDIYWTFDELARAPEWLKAHRDWVEANEWGFGDRALHHMWSIVLEYLAERDGAVRCLEIGVFKGQVISLWALIAAQRGFDVSVAALSPFAGSEQQVVQNRLLHKLRSMISTKYREDQDAGMYVDRDYLGDCRRIFTQFGLDFDKVEVFRGFSNDPAILAVLEPRSFNLIYIDGDHSEEVATQDVHHFAPMVAPGGIVVMDDASLSLEMDLSYRGRPGSTVAADLLPSLGFRNVLNIGHNRIFQKA